MGGLYLEGRNRRSKDGSRWERQRELTSACVLVRSFFCSTYTTLRTLLPLLGPHPLDRRTTGSAVGPYGAAPSPCVEQKVRLKPPRLLSHSCSDLCRFASNLLNVSLHTSPL
jgi:hypothetical protein